MKWKKCEFWGIKKHTLKSFIFQTYCVWHGVSDLPTLQPHCSTGSLPMSDSNNDIPPVLKPTDSSFPLYPLENPVSCTYPESHLCHHLTANTLVPTTITPWLDYCYSLLNGLFYLCSPMGHSQHRRKSDTPTVSQIMSWLLSTSLISLLLLSLFLFVIQF